MAPPGPPRPRVSRETRLLLATVLCSLIVLALLARLRFPERPATPNPVAPLLTQLAPRPVFEDLASAVAELQPKILRAIFALDVRRVVSTERLDSTRHVIPALRFRDDAAIALAGAAQGIEIAGVDVVAQDPATGLAVVRTPRSAVLPPPSWTPQRPQQPRYLMVTEVSPTGASLRPVFFGALRETPSPRWSAPVWTVPSHAGVPVGAFVFTTIGALAGLVGEQGGAAVIVPIETVIAAAERLLATGQTPRGTVGVEIQELIPPIAAAAGVTSGVVVTWIDPEGPAASALVATDIIEAIGSDSMATPEHWRARTARLTAGETIIIRVRRVGRVDDVRVTAAPFSAPASSPRLGLTMRARAGIGAEVTRVDERSVAARAGINVGDVITRIGDLATPTPVQVRREFDRRPKDAAVTMAITRGVEHLVVALVKR